MKRWIVGLAVIAMVAALFAQEEGPAIARGSAVDTTGRGYSAAYVIEPTTRHVLFEENAHLPLPTASMAKMMTCLIAMEEIRDGRLGLDTPVTISPFASHMGGSRIYAKDGQVFALQTLLAATMIQSANDAATAIAEKIAGSEQIFADLMNRRAQQLGFSGSKFFDPHGLPNRSDPTRVNTMSAHDLAILGIELMKYPLMREYARTPAMPFANGTFTSGLTNPNRLINPKKRDYYDAATGIKTGYTAQAGFCLTASARKGDMELVCVVIGAKSESGPQSSFGIAARLMSDAFANYRMVDVLRKGTTVGQAPVTGGQSKVVPAMASADARALVRWGQEGAVQRSFTASNVTAPVRRGERVGTIVVRQNGRAISRTAALAGADIARQPWWRRFWPF
jgi:D-alanyl-D-alanine carboxypeptidase (penicillin-binding protein 5/6)